MTGDFSPERPRTCKEAPLRASRGGALCVLTLLFGKVFFRIRFVLGLEGLPVPIERKSGLDPRLVGPPYGLELPLAPLQHRDVLLAGSQYGRCPHLADPRRAPGRHELRGVRRPPDLVRVHQRPVRLGETRLFYCDPRQSQQKGACEKNHVEIRKLLPKGAGVRFDRLTAADCALLMSQVNSEPRGRSGS